MERDMVAKLAEIQNEKPAELCGNPLDTTIALSHLIFEGTLERFPGLKVCAAHGGGYLPAYGPRSDRSCMVSPANCDPNIKLKKKPMEYLRQMYFDSLIFTPEALRHLLDSRREPDHARHQATARPLIAHGCRWRRRSGGRFLMTIDLKQGVPGRWRAVLGCMLLFVAMTNLHAAPCLIVTITGAMGGPPNFNGLAGPGTLVRYGDDSNDCSAVRLQFDAGRATSVRLSQAGVTPGQLNAIFFTHMHSDHVDGFADIMQLRWHYNAKGPKLDIVCSADVATPQGFTVSCAKLAAHVADAYLQSGEIAQRVSEDKSRPASGPAELTRVMTFEPKNEPQVVWSSGDVKVSAIRSTHIPGHASYRVDSPAGSVVIGGDAGNDTFAPPRASSTSDQVEKLAAGADVIVHSAIHPVMAPDRGGGMPAPFYFRQSAAPDLGAMASRTGAKHLVLTHLIPPVGSERQGFYKVPGGALTEADYRTAAQSGGFTGNIVVGKDLISIRLPAK